MNIKVTLKYKMSYHLMPAVIYFCNIKYNISLLCNCQDDSVITESVHQSWEEPSCYVFKEIGRTETANFQFISTFWSLCMLLVYKQL